MRIAVIGAKGLPAGQGGIERYCQELYPRVVAQGHSVDLFARPSYTQSPWFSSHNYMGVRIICLPSLPLRGLDALTSSAFGAIASIIRCYDIVHFHALGPALFTWIPKIASSSGMVVTCQGLDWQRAKWGKFSSRLIHLGERAAVNYAHEVIVVSEYLQSYFWNTYGIETTYIPNAPGSYPESNPKFSYGASLGLEQERYVLFLGRLVPEKRPDLLIEAFQLLKPAGWKLVLAGSNSDTTAFNSKLVSMAAGNEDVIFTGELQGGCLAEIVRGAGLFVLPSDLEGLPLVMLEAMREGIPVLASNIPPHQQLIGQERGLLFQAGDKASCVRCLEQALHQPPELAAMARNAQSYVEANYSWDHITMEVLKLYTALSPSSSPSSAQLQGSDRPINAFSSIDKARVKPIGSYLVEAGLLTQGQINQALAEQQTNRVQLGQILVQRGWIKNQTIDYFMEKVILPERETARKGDTFQSNLSQEERPNQVEVVS